MLFVIDLYIFIIYYLFIIKFVHTVAYTIK